MTAHRGYARRYSDAQLVPEVAKELAIEQEVKRRVSISTIYDPKKTDQSSLAGSKGRFVWQTSLDKPDTSNFIVNNPSTWKSPKTNENQKEVPRKDSSKAGQAQGKLTPVPENKEGKSSNTKQAEIPSWKKDLFDKASKLANPS